MASNGSRSAMRAHARWPIPPIVVLMMACIAWTGGCHRDSTATLTVAPENAQTEAQALYAERCAACHGASGEGDGPASRSLQPPPRSFSDPAWQRNTGDDQIRTVIRQGGAKTFERASAMPAHTDLTAVQLDLLVMKVRTFGPARDRVSVEISSMTPWILFRILKFLGLAAFAAGLVGAVIPVARRQRMQMTYAYAVPGFIVAYASGWLLLKASGRALLTSWVLVGALMGFSALHVAFLASHRPQPRAITGPLAWGSAVAALLVMVARMEGDAIGLAVVTLVGVVIGAVVARPWAKTAVEARPEDNAIAWRGLLWITRIEGASLLLMVMVSIPARVWLDIRIDGGTGLIGWVHGILVLVFVQTLASVRRLFSLPRSELAVGVASALVPGGSFWFERRLRQLDANRRRASRGSIGSAHDDLHAG